MPEDYEALKRRIMDRHGGDVSGLMDALTLCVDTNDHETNKEIRKRAHGLIVNGGGTAALDLYNRTLLFDAQGGDFDCAFRYAECEREPNKQFYLPRRKQLLPVVRALEDLNSRKIRILGIMAPPGVGKTTVAEMAMVCMGCQHPELSILGASHSNSFLRGVYEEMIRMLDPKGEYLFHRIFPDSPIVKTNAADMRIDLGNRKRFETFEFSSVGSGNAGKVRASNLLYADDLVDGIESAMSRERMDKLWQQYHTDLRQRMIGDCVELLIQTPWSLHDPIDRLEQMNYDNPLARFIHLPALDENDESNFDYPHGLGFTTKFYHEQRDIMDDASWRALYLTKPVEREGQLYPEEELRRYFELPEVEPDGIIAVTDTKDTGKDFCCMLIAYQYGQDFYIEDLVYENYAPQIIDEQLTTKLVKHRVQICQFESNAAGGRTADKVQEKVKERGGITRITKKWTSTNKETKIIVASPFVKEHFLFKDATVIRGDKEYRAFLNALCGYTLAGKNKHDDAPDAAAQLANYVQGLTVARVEVFKRPF